MHFVLETVWLGSRYYDQENKSNMQRKLFFRFLKILKRMLQNQEKCFMLIVKESRFKTMRRVTSL